LDPTGQDFTADWFSSHIANWAQLLAPLRGLESLKFLEIGSFEGRSATWLLENILTHPSSLLHCVDSFECVGVYESRYGCSTEGAEKRLRRNLGRFGDRVRFHRERSQVFLTSGAVPDGSLDFVYVDGSHRADDVLMDALLSWKLLKAGGIMLFDDYQAAFDQDEFWHPTRGIDAFLHVHWDQFEPLFKGYQLAIRKRTRPGH
jgi:hypothetical protein